MTRSAAVGYVLVVLGVLAQWWNTTGRNAVRWLFNAAAVLVVGGGLVVTAAGAFNAYRTAQARQVWGLYAIAPGGDPVELGRYEYAGQCEDMKTVTGRYNYERGVVVGLKCQGVRPLWERLQEVLKERRPR